LSSGEYSKPDYTAISENNLPDYIKVISWKVIKIYELYKKSALMQALTQKYT
jgi:hypothetical protein